MGDAIPETALKWVDAGQRVALATVASCWGSAPRRPGSQMVISQAGEFEGSVSGGCVEAAVVASAQAMLTRNEAPRLLRFSVSDGDAFAAGLACGGQIEVLLDPVGDAPGLPVTQLRALVAARAARRATVTRLNLKTGARALESQDGTMVSQRQGDVVVTAHLPSPRLFVVGATHLAQVLAPMAGLAGFDVTVIDPRPAFASKARFPGAVLVDDWPDRAFEALAPDAFTALAVVSHDAKIDDPALRSGLASEAFYVGVLGSRKTHAARIERLHLSEAEAARLHAPIGLAIGAATPAEIAVAILSEIIACRRGIPIGRAPERI
jgi:xanthine dehydrogenase accessory factor